MSQVFIGHDAREQAAYDVAEFSLRQRSSVPIAVRPLSRHTIALPRPVIHRDGQMWCPISRAPMTTDFAIARFAVPRLVRDGWALFVDCDVVFHADVADLFALADDRYAVMVVQHAYTPTETTKMDGQAQTAYRRKNWSSVVLWNCGHPAHQYLDPVVLAWPGRALHGFEWLDDADIGALPPEWNVLVGVQPVPKNASILHYTLGGPWCGVPDPVGAWDAERVAMRHRHAA